MQIISAEKLELIQNKIKEILPLEGCVFDSEYDDSIELTQHIIVMRRYYSNVLKSIYVVSLTPCTEENNSGLEKLAKNKFDNSNAKFGYYGFCTISEAEIVTLTNYDYQFERLNNK